jgi:prevent-host-death family protein
MAASRISPGRSGGSAKSRAPKPFRAAIDGSPLAQLTDTEALRKRGYKMVNATQAKNRFGEILRAVREDAPVFIEKHGSAHAVVLDVGAYFSLVQKARAPHELGLDALRAEFAAMYSAMQSAKSRKAVDSLLKASADTLNARRKPRRKPHG